MFDALHQLMKQTSCNRMTVILDNKGEGELQVIVSSKFDPPSKDDNHSLRSALSNPLALRGSAVEVEQHFVNSVFKYSDNLQLIKKDFETNAETAGKPNAVKDEAKQGDDKDSKSSTDEQTSTEQVNESLDYVEAPTEL